MTVDQISEPDETLIEQYVLVPSALTDAQQQYVEQLLATDEPSRQIAAYLQSFYKELQGTNPGALGRIEDLLAKGVGQEG